MIDKRTVDLTSYDLLKSFALITMVIDHVGYYLFPEDIGWRVVGRLSLPVWLFLIGYARTREINQALVLAAVIVTASNFLLGEGALPLNILFTIMLARLTIDAIMTRALASSRDMVMEVLFLAVVGVAASYIVDYGTHALLFAMLGYLVRHRERIGYSDRHVLVFAMAVSVVHTITQVYLFEAGVLAGGLMLLGITAVGLLLTRFRAAQFPKLTQRLPMPSVAVMQLMGRRTLLLYVAHLLVLKGLAAWLVWKTIPWFEWVWFRTG